MARPSPVPPVVRRVPGTRTNGSKIRSNSSAGMPGPWSDTWMMAVPECRRSRRLSWTRPPGGECLMALSTRMSTSWSRRLAVGCDGQAGDTILRHGEARTSGLSDGCSATREVREPCLQIDGLWVERDGTRLGRGQGEQVVDQSPEAVRLADDVGHQGGAIPGHEAFALQDLRRGTDDGDRRLQLVRGGGHEAPLGGEGLADGHQGALRDHERHDHGAQDPQRSDDDDGQQQLPLEAVLEGHVHAGLHVERARTRPRSSSSCLALVDCDVASPATRIVRRRTSVLPIAAVPQVLALLGGGDGGTIRQAGQPGVPRAATQERPSPEARITKVSASPSALPEPASDSPSRSWCSTSGSPAARSRARSTDSRMSVMAVTAVVTPTMMTSVVTVAQGQEGEAGPGPAEERLGRVDGTAPPLHGCPSTRSE